MIDRYTQYSFAIKGLEDKSNWQMKSWEKGLLTDTLTENADTVNTPSSTFSMYTQSVNFFFLNPA